MAAGECRIPLPRGMFALVDAGDFERISAHRWHLKRKLNQPTKFYAQRTIRLGNGRRAPKTAVTMHREIMQAPAGMIVDHINGNGLDNRRCNLRLTDARGNCTNVRSSKHQKLGRYKGVSWNANAGKWQAAIGGGEIKANGKRRLLYLGLFTDPVEAARAYDAAALKHFGEFAALNFPPEVARAG